MDVSTTSTHRGNAFLWCFRTCCLWERPRTLSMIETNKNRWKEFGYKSTAYSLPPIFAFLIDLYDGKDVIEGLESCRINPDYASEKHLRNDLEYYIPQLTNFVVFHEDFVCEKLMNFLEDASKADPYFAHYYYWYINSLLAALSHDKAQVILEYIVTECSREPKTQLFIPHYEKFFWALQKKLPKDEYEEKVKEIESRKEPAERIIQSYKADDLNLNISNFNLKVLDIELKSYVSSDPQAESGTVSNPFTSTILFLNDLYRLAEDLIKKQITDKVSYLKSTLHAVNKSLPACVYMPFVKDSIRHYAILNIVIDETRVFSTKQRAPFYLCMEIFRPQEELSYEYNEIFHIEDAPKRPKKKNKFVDWAKKALKIKPKKKAIRDSRMSTFYQKEPDEQFKVSNLAELVSSPVTLKRIFRSHEGASYTENRIQKQSTKSLIVHSGHRSFLDLLHQEDFKTSEKNPAKLTIPNRFGAVRKLTGDDENDMGISVAYQEEGSSIVSSSEASGPKENRSDLSSFNKSTSFKDSITLKQELKLSTNLNEPLWEEDKEGDSRSNSDKDSNDGMKESVLSHEDSMDFFGEDSKDQIKRIKENSPFKHLKSWRLIHVIVKTGADMKEEQFAIQLISQFDQIFKDEKVKLILTPYEILSLGSDFGILEVVKDAITMSRLKEKMYRHNITSLNEFFDRYYGKEADRARKRFCRSLAAYSLVCYFLQIKDRHNGNILFHKLGHILHIDFGFLLTNSPGKGLEFERKVPFKLLNEYVEVLGGPRSGFFQEFRKLFYRGFMAARKHREQILILVKMMYSTQGANLPCFKAGDRAIVELEQRFCPPGIHERDLMGYCYNLINQSLDNWRAKCYDKYQYHFQGIFY